MDEHVGDPVKLLAQPVAHLAGDVMPDEYGDSGIHLDVQIDVILETGFAGETLFDAFHPRDAHGDFANARQTPIVRHGVHQLQTGIARDADASEDDDDADGKTAVMIGAKESNRIEERKPGTSAMPTDLLQQLSKAEIRDLVEYLSSLK